MIDERCTLTNCLSFMVTCEFLQLRHVAMHILEKRFLPSFVDIINNCKLNLNSLNQKLVSEMAKHLTLDKVI